MVRNQAKMEREARAAASAAEGTMFELQEGLAEAKSALQAIKEKEV